MIDFDFESAFKKAGEKKEFQPIPDGEYKGRCLKATYEEGKDGKAPRFVFEFQIEEEGPYKNRKIWENCPLQENMIWKLAQITHGMGYTGTAKNPEDIIAILADFEWKPVTMQVSQSEYKGKIYNNVNEVSEGWDQSEKDVEF